MQKVFFFFCHRVKLQTKTSTQVYCNIYRTTFDVVALNFGQQKSGSSYKTMRGHIKHYPSKTFCQYMYSGVLPHEPYYPDLSPCFSTSHDWHEHWEAIALLTFRQFRESWKKKQHCRKCFSWLLKGPPETLEAVYWCRWRLFRRRFLVSEFKYTISLGTIRTYVVLCLRLQAFFSYPPWKWQLCSDKPCVNSYFIDISCTVLFIVIVFYRARF
jgi:hypothetical protein